MEFYLRFSSHCPSCACFNSQRDGILPGAYELTKLKRKSFNSQRDGILLELPPALKRKHYVSIPNGMEFYVAFGVSEDPSTSFNSQRDGILQEKD